MKRPVSTSPLPSKEIGSRSSYKPSHDAAVTHRNADASQVVPDTSALSILSGGPARNSQDLDLDWSKFENHTFFDSAAGKVNASFLRIINEFPYDGSEKDLREFLSNLTGFEKYVYDLFPKSVGYVDFLGTSHITVKDSAGAAYPDYSRDSTGREVLSPEGGPFTVQFFINPAAAVNGNQVIAQYSSDSTHGYTLLLSQSSSTSTAKLNFSIVSGSLSASLQTDVDKGKFQHVAAMYSSNGVTSSLSIYKDGILNATSSEVVRLGTSFSAPQLTIASGTSYYSQGVQIVPAERLNAAIDDLRVYHAARSEEEIRRSMSYADFADSDIKMQGLALYYKFNEPPGNHAQQSVVLDSSGNCLHSNLQGIYARVTGSSALSYEDETHSPVLFPDFSETAAINSDLLVSGTSYDDENPNYIIKLIPRHYFLEAQNDYSLTSEQGDLDRQIAGTGVPGSGELGSVQITTAILLMYAKVFDEIKIFHDHFSRLTYVDYDANDSVSNKFLTFLASYYGIELPNLFGEATINQYTFGQDVLTSQKTELPLQTVQSQIFRRILTNIREIVSSKGTHAGIRALFNAVGIAPNAFFRIREYGGPTAVDLSTVREDVTEVAAKLDLSGSLINSSTTTNTLGFGDRSPYVTGSFLSGSRVEVGYPYPLGSFVDASPGRFHGVSNSVNDGLLTSGSWTLEASYRFDSKARGDQSLMRLHVTGTASPSSTHGVVLNVVAVSGSQPTVNAYLAADTTSAAPPVALHITGADVYDGNRWHIAFSRTRDDDPRLMGTYASSSYTLYCTRVTQGGGATVYTASAFFDEGSASNSVLQNVSSYNTSGSFVVFGSQSLAVGSHPFLNNAALPEEVRVTDFSGKISEVRFWSKSLTSTEISEHARSFRSVGVDNPIINFGFNTTSTGSFEKLRMNISCDQDVTGSNSLGGITLIDFSQQGRNASGFGFEPDVSIIKPETYSFSQLSTRFDTRQTSEKVRVRSFSEAQNLIDFPESQPSPIYEQVKSEQPESDSRLSIEASAVDAVNDDIVKLLSSLDFFENALGDPRVLCEDDYPDLDRLRRIYFNRLTAKPDLRAMYDVFKWVSDSLGSLIVQIVPMNSVFLGVSYVVESHVAERARIKYTFDSVYKEKTVTQHRDRSVNDIAATTSRNASELLSSPASTRLRSVRK